ncbi:hypothetical protein [Rahnella aceris]
MSKNLSVFLSVFAATTAGVMLANGTPGWWLVGGIGLYLLSKND